MVGGEKVGRFSFLGYRAVFAVSRRAATSDDHRNGRSPDPARRFRSADPFRDLQQLVERYRAVHLKGLPRFAGGAVGYASYDAVRYTENLPRRPARRSGLPDLSFAFYDRMVIFDHIRKTMLVVAHAHVGPGARPEAAYERACDGSTNWSVGWPPPGPI